MDTLAARGSFQWLVSGRKGWLAQERRVKAGNTAFGTREAGLAVINLNARSKGR